jgi:hypothetical protein
MYRKIGFYDYRRWISGKRVLYKYDSEKVSQKPMNEHEKKSNSSIENKNSEIDVILY